MLEKYNPGADKKIVIIVLIVGIFQKLTEEKLNCLKLRLFRGQDLFGSQIPVTTGGFELRISCMRTH